MILPTPGYFKWNCKPWSTDLCPGLIKKYSNQLGYSQPLPQSLSPSPTPGKFNTFKESRVFHLRRLFGFLCSFVAECGKAPKEPTEETGSAWKKVRIATPLLDGLLFMQQTWCFALWADRIGEKLKLEAGGEVEREAVIEHWSIHIVWGWGSCWELQEFRGCTTCLPPTRPSVCPKRGHLALLPLKGRVNWS